MQTSPVWLLTLLFVGLKLTNYIDWSWWWVLAPIWMPLTFLVGLWLGAITFFMSREYNPEEANILRKVNKYILKVISFYRKD